MTGTYFGELLFYNRTIGAKVPNGRDEAKRSPEAFIASGKVNFKKIGSREEFLGECNRRSLEFLCLLGGFY